MLTLSTILVPTDFSDAARVALSWASHLAAASSAEVHVMHVVDTLSARFVDVPDYAVLGRHQTALEQAARRDLDALLLDATRAGVTARGILQTDRSPARAIAEYASEAAVDLIVMGTHGRGAIGRVFLGSVAGRIIRTAPCPVMTLRESVLAEPEHVLSVAAAADGLP